MNKIMKNLLGGAAIAALSVVAGQQAHAAIVTSDVNIVTSTLWTSNNVYVLTNVTYVSAGSTLTIEPGTVIRGKAPSSPGAGDPGALVICRGSKIQAVGTVDHPIIFTDMNDDNVPGMTPLPGGGYDTWSQIFGNWGGLIVLGKTYVAFDTFTGPDPTISRQIEGVTANGALGLFGGNDDDDNSGKMQYIQLRYGGAGLTLNNEINGLTMGAVGRGTTIDHIEILNNLDDGIECFGGTVNMKNLVIWGIGDDSLDTDEGYRGKTQFGLIVQGDAGGASVGSGIADKGFETDGGGSTGDSGAASAQPYALSRHYNWTAIGKGQSGGGGTYTSKAKNTAWHIRDNAGPQVFNSLFLDFGGAGVIVEAEGGDAAVNSKQRFNTAWNDFSFHGTAVTNLPASYFYKTQEAGYQCDFADNIWWQFGGPIAATTPAEVTAAGGGSQSVDSFGGAYRAWPTSVNTVLGTMPITTLTRSGSAAANHMYNVTYLDPRPVDLAGVDALTPTRTAPADGFCTPVSYKGAFDQNCMWTKGWTHVTKLGLLPSPACPASGSAPATVDLTLLSHVKFATAANVLYQIEASSDMVNWSPIGLVVGDGTEKTFTDERGLSTRQFYRVVPQ